MAPDPLDDRSWVPQVAERRVSDIEATLAALASWIASPNRQFDLLVERRLVDEVLDVGWRELIDLVRQPEIQQELLDRLVDVCEQGIDIWQRADLPRPYEQTLQTLASSILELDEEVFIADDYDPEADEDDPRSTYRVPWWLGW